MQLQHNITIILLALVLGGLDRSMVFGPNDSPLAGRAGKAVTGRVIGERLLAEVILRICQASVKHP